MINYKTLSEMYELEVYPKRDLTIVRGKGAKLWDHEGREFVDCVGGQGSVNVGHCNPKVIEAITAQAQRLITCPGIFYNDMRSVLLERLVSLAPANIKRAFLCNSGAESVEAAIKFTRFTTNRPGFIACMKAFHGRTMGALSATHNPKYREGFEPLMDGVVHVPFNNFEKLMEAATDKIGGIILEPVQGEGGINIIDREYLQNVRELCTKRGILLILDEVQTGFGRTGKMFALEHFGVNPDIICVAKSLAGGLPMGATLCADSVRMEVGKHGTTFGGGPVVCAAAIATIEYLIETGLHKQVEKKAHYLVDKINQSKLSAVREIRHLGLMIGIQLKDKSKEPIVRLLEEGVLALPAGPTVIRLLPPLVITYEEMDFVAAKVTKVLREMAD